MRHLLSLRHALAPALWGGATVLLSMDLLATVKSWNLAPALSDRQPAGGPSLFSRAVARARSVLRRRDPAVWEEAAYSLAFHIRAGETPAQALRAVSTERDTPAHFGLRKAIQMYDAGSSLEAALVAQSGEHPEIPYLAGIFEMGLSSGADIPALLCHGAESMRRRRLARDETRARLVEARATAVLLSILPWLIAAFTVGRDPKTRATVLADPRGRVLIALSLFLWVVGNVAVVMLLGSLSPKAVSRRPSERGPRR